MWLHQSDPIFNMGVEFMRPAFNFEPKYRVTMLTIEEWTKGPGTPLATKGLIWYTDGSRRQGGGGGLELESMDNLQEGGSTCL